MDHEISRNDKHLNHVMKIKSKNNPTIIGNTIKKQKSQLKFLIFILQDAIITSQLRTTLTAIYPFLYFFELKQVYHFKLLTESLKTL